MRRLVVCSDGTWNTPNRTPGGEFVPSNVVRVAESVRPSAPDGTAQIVFYDPGVGTGNILDKYTGGAFGVGLSRNVQDAYRFLVHNYEEGDEIYVFGFSRGAYTVRSAVGLIRKAGLLKKLHADLVSDAFRLYRKRDETPDTEEARNFRAQYSRDVRIKFIGVWDTVGALGIPIDVFRFLSKGRYEFHDVSLSRSVDFAYHAVAIDERRGPFEPTLWEQHPEATEQVMEQVWFVGVHMDVGGGYRDADLSLGPFLWMADKASTTGLAFDESALAGLQPRPGGRIHESRTFPYNLLPAYIRPIGLLERGNETLHSTVRERHQSDPAYRPKNLVDYLQRQTG
jgi:uncharacterized protein (DUF2235 family)